MNNLKTLALVLLFAVLTSLIAHAAFTVTLVDPVAVGSTGIATTEQMYVGNGSWKNNGTKFNLYLDPALAFGRAIMLTEIADLSFNTYKVTPQNGLNFYINIYTAPDGVNDDGSWYGHRLSLEPLYSKNFSDVTGIWNKFSTSIGTNQLTVFDGNRTNIGFYNGPTLADVQSGPLNWGNYPTSGSTQTVDYSGEAVGLIAVDTGNPWATNFEGYIDNVVITLTNGESVAINLDVAVGPPTDRDQCKKDGWMTFNNPVFMNQGECVSYVNN